MVGREKKDMTSWMAKISSMNILEKGASLYVIFSYECLISK